MDLQSAAAERRLSPWCICTTVSRQALDALLENGDAGAYRDSHPWLAARDLLQAERAAGRVLPILFASNSPLEFVHWAIVKEIEVVEFRRGRWESRCDFERLRPMHPIWTALDSVMLKPGDDQLRREAVEPLPLLRNALDERHVRPYAICETPPFMTASSESATGEAEKS